MKTDLTTWQVGPYHGALPGPMVLSLRIDGEIIVNAEVEAGFLHRGLEKAFELHSWLGGIPYSDHVDPESAIFGELAFCMAVERIGNIEVPPRAQAIRVILSELTRISCHLAFISRIARAVGSDSMIHYVLRDREKLLDLFELLTGARFSLNFLRYGGVSADVSEGFIERVLETCELTRIRLKEYNDLFTYNQAFVKRASGLAIAPESLLKSWGVTGPNARASGINTDIRKTSPYSGYERYDFSIPNSPGYGDTHSRFLIRLREISQSIELLKQACDSIPAGEFISRVNDGGMAIPAGEAYVKVESARGLFGCHVVSDGGFRPYRVQFRTPSMASLQAVSEIVCGARVDDMPVILASLDVSLAEVDR